MDNSVAGCQPPAGATPLFRFGLPSPPGVVGMVMAPGSASGKHPFYVVCKCGLGCCVCGGCRVGVGVWGLGLLVVLHVRALFVGGGGCVWVKCPCPSPLSALSLCWSNSTLVPLLCPAMTQPTAQDLGRGIFTLLSMAVHDFVTCRPKVQSTEPSSTHPKMKSRETPFNSGTHTAHRHHSGQQRRRQPETACQRTYIIPLIDNAFNSIVVAHVSKTSI